MLDHRKVEINTSGSSFLAKLAIAVGIAATVTIISLWFKMPTFGPSSVFPYLADVSSVPASSPAGLTLTIFGYRVQLPEYTPGYALNLGLEFCFPLYLLYMHMCLRLQWHLLKHYQGEIHKNAFLIQIPITFHFFTFDGHQINSFVMFIDKHVFLYFFNIQSFISMLVVCHGVVGE